jgi:hypothetical protein
MEIMKKVMLIMPIIISFALCGCALTLPMASVDQDNKAKTFVTRNDKANIYVYRNEIFAFAVALPLVLDGKSVGALAAKTYLLLVVPPGEHGLLCDSENGSVLRLSVEAGRNYFVWLEAKTGFLNLRSNLQIVDEINGRKGVEECSLIEAAN